MPLCCTLRVSRNRSRSPVQKQQLPRKRPWQWPSGSWQTRWLEELAGSAVTQTQGHEESPADSGAARPPPQEEGGGSWGRHSARGDSAKLG